MHFHPILLVQADNLEDAKAIARDFCDCECGDHSLYDYGSVVPDNETEWNKPLIEIKEKLPKDDHLKQADLMLSRANAELKQRNHGMAGYYFNRAGELFSQQFSTEYPIFNIQYYDYNQDYGDGWYAIEADLHL